MEKEFKIFGVGKGTRITYKSLDEAKLIIEKNKIEPHGENSYVGIEETTRKLHKIECKIPTLSIDNKKFLIDYVLKNLTPSTIASRDNISNILYVIKYPNTHPILKDLLTKWAINEYNIIDEELKSTLLVEEIYNTPLFERMNDYNINAVGYVKCIKELFEIVEPNDFKFTYNITNYKPCHNILIELPTKDDNYRTTFNLQIRVDDFPYNEGPCYGRNTTVVNTIKLHDENFEKYCKSLKIK
jgi:hypothetical protein